MQNKLNTAIRQFMVNQIEIYGQMTSEDLVKNTKRAFPIASSKQVAGNLSAVCCYFRDLTYDNGTVS